MGYDLTVLETATLPKTQSRQPNRLDRAIPDRLSVSNYSLHLHQPSSCSYLEPQITMPPLRPQIRRISLTPCRVSSLPQQCLPMRPFKLRAPPKAANSNYTTSSSSTSSNPLQHQHLPLRSSPPAPLSLSSTRALSSSPAHQSAEHGSNDHGGHGGGHESHYDPPGGWLWGIPPGEQYQKEGWENTFVYGYCGTLLIGLVLYAYKPDTSYVSPLFPHHPNLNTFRLSSLFSYFLTLWLWELVLRS